MIKLFFLYSIEDFLKEIVLIVIGIVLGVILEFIRKKVSLFKEKQNDKIINEYEKTICDSEFINFRNTILEEYYGSDNWTKIEERKFPVYSFEAISNYPYPFDELYDKSKLKLLEKQFNKIIDFKKIKYYKEYKNLMENKNEKYKRVKRPKYPGYMLDKIQLSKENKVVYFTAWAGIYEQNVYTSHILEYELYVMYKKYKNITPDYYHKIKNELTIRNKIHFGKETFDGQFMFDAFSTGCNRASLLGVQLIVLFKDKDKQYKFIIMERSKDVAARPGFYQFPPSGGFEVHKWDNEWDTRKRENIIKENFSIEHAIFREYLEEVFGVENYVSGESSDATKEIDGEQQVKTIKSLIKNGTAKFEFLGITVELVTLRHELSFVLRIEDSDEFTENIKFFKTNHEHKGGKVLTIPKNDINEIIKSETRLINEGSAGLWYLFSKSHLFKEIVSPSLPLDNLSQPPKRPRNSPKNENGNNNRQNGSR